MKCGSVLLSFVIFAVGCALPVCPARAAAVTVFAAASLTDALKEIASAWKTNGGQAVAFNFGASSTLARQIQEGAPADIFFSADEAKMNGLDQKGLLVRASRKSRLSNALAVIVAADSGLRITSPSDLAGDGIKHLALADPRAVPAGIYARAWLEKHRLWTALERRVVPGDNVRAALAAVASGNAEAGIVFRTDAAISRKVRIALAIPASETPDISYSVALLKDSPRAREAALFLEYLNSRVASLVFEKFGFIVRD